MKAFIPFPITATFLLLVSATCHAATYHLHPVSGDDNSSGTSPDTPWKTLEKINSVRLRAGDRVLLAGGQTFHGQLEFDGISGTADSPVVFGSYAPREAAGDTRATIDARGCVAAIHLKNCSHVEIRDLELTANGGGMRGGQPPKDGMRCGILIEADADGQYEGFRLGNLLVKDISYEEPGFVRPLADVKTANGTARYGWGIRFMVRSATAVMKDISVDGCQIENVNHTGLKITGPGNSIRYVSVGRLRVLHAGGPGVQMSGVCGGHFSGLHINGSGSIADTRNWGRGSGLWTWGSSDIVIEKSEFLNANGPGDSAGVHIDYNCSNVVVQYNLSANNAGGFCEVLGNNHNCAYRYNISVNDGQRVKGRDGAFQEGKTFWLSGYTGAKSPLKGPFNTYFYNNTIHVGEEYTAKIAVSPTSEGVLIVNNVFCIRGSSRMVTGDQFRPDSGRKAAPRNVVFSNNLFIREDNWPAGLALRDRSPVLGDPGLVNAGGLRLEDYIPRNTALIRDRGIQIPKIPQDETGLTVGLKVERDILGHEITGAPDLGAIELPVEPAR